MRANRSVVFAAVLALLLSGTAMADTSLTVVPEAAMSGTNYGLRVNFDGGTGNAYVQDDTPAAETTYRAKFMIRNGCSDEVNGSADTMVNGATHQVFRARMPGETVIRLQLKKANTGGDFVVFVWARLDSGAYTPPIMTFANRVHELTVEWAAATAPGANNGVLRLYKGTNMINEFINLDNDTYSIDLVQLGAFGGVDATTTGYIDLDEFESYRTFLP